MISSEKEVESLPKEIRSSVERKIQTCEELQQEGETGNVGGIVAKHEKLILHYYEDVLKQANDSFRLAKIISILGFAVLILTWLYTLGFDFVRYLHPFQGAPVGSKQAISMGVVSGVLIEFIAGVNFWLYSKASKQFGAFHVCLERTHRYLIAYKIADETTSRREMVLENIACIMASAPMIGSPDSGQNNNQNPINLSRPGRAEV